MEKRLDGVVQYRLSEATEKLEGRFEDLERAHRLEQLDRIQGRSHAEGRAARGRAAEVDQIRKSVAALKGKLQGTPAPAPAPPAAK